MKELKNDLSAYLRRVGRGERVRITLRGEAVADLVPAARSPADARYRELVARGKVTPARAPLPARAPGPVHAGRSASAEILVEREAES